MAVRDFDVTWVLHRETPGEAPWQIELPLGLRLVVGRSPDAPISLPTDGAVSRYHAAFEASTMGVALLDLDSRNGVFVNDQKQRSALLLAGDRVRIGATTLRVEARQVPRTTPDVTGERAAFVTPEAMLATVKAIPYRCELCGTTGPVPAVDHPMWFSEVAWICSPCTETRRTPAASWPVDVPAVVGDFELLRFVARGGSAAVYEARHAKAGVRVALKVMLPERTLDPASAKRFVKEQRIVGSLAHDRIVRCFGAGTLSDGRLYVATELLSAGDAESTAHPRLAARDAVSIAADMFDALAFAHGKGFVHRDVKPGNLLLGKPTKSGLPRAKLADFGLAKSYRDIGGTIVTKEGEVGGSPSFVAPEQLLGFRDVGPSADVYSASCTFYYLLTRDLPVVLPCSFEEAHETQFCLATLADDRVSIRVRRPDIHPWIAEWIDLGTCRDHRRRAHVDAATFAGTLLSYLQSIR